MNERITEIMQECETEYSTSYEPSYDMDKFAEMIMQDMHKKVIASILITDVVMEEKGQVPTSEDYIRAINKDFGVTE